MVLETICLERAFTCVSSDKSVTLMYTMCVKPSEPPFSTPSTNINQRTRSFCNTFHRTAGLKPSCLKRLLRDHQPSVHRFLIVIINESYPTSCPPRPHIRPYSDGIEYCRPVLPHPFAVPGTMGSRFSKTNGIKKRVCDTDPWAALNLPQQLIGYDRSESSKFPAGRPVGLRVVRSVLS